MPKKPEWMVAIEIEKEGQLPALVYEGSSGRMLPFAFAFFTNAPSANQFIGKLNLKGMKATPIKLFQDIPLNGFLNWASACVNNILRTFGKEVSPDELNTLIYTKMPVIVNPRDHKLRHDKKGNVKVDYINLFHFIQELFSFEQVAESLRDTEYVDTKHIEIGLQAFTIRYYKRNDELFGICRTGIYMPQDESFLSSDMRLGINVYVTHTYKTEDKKEIENECNTWWANLQAEKKAFAEAKAKQKATDQGQVDPSLQGSEQGRPDTGKDPAAPDPAEGRLNPESSA